MRKDHPAHVGGLGQRHRIPILILLGSVVGGDQRTLDQRAFYIANAGLAFGNGGQAVGNRGGHGSEGFGRFGNDFFNRHRFGGHQVIRQVGAQVAVGFLAFHQFRHRAGDLGTQLFIAAVGPSQAGGMNPLTDVLAIPGHAPRTLAVPFQ